MRQGKDALKSRDIINFINTNFMEEISMGSYDDIRHKDFKLPVVAGIIIASANKPGSARNDPTRGFSLSPEYLEIIRSFGQENWIDILDEFMQDRSSLSDRLASTRELDLIPISLPDGKVLSFSPGEHNVLQKKIIEDFLPRFGFGAELLYVGDTANRYLIKNEPELKDLCFFELEHGELPDIVAYSRMKNWIFLIEAVL